MVLDAFARERRRSMTKLWEDHFSQHRGGFEMFTSPLYENASALIIGYNPGGQLNRDQMNERMQSFTDGDFTSVLEKHKHYHPDYLPDYASTSPLPGRIRRYLFHRKEDLLRRAVETNRYFMRTNGKREHREFVQSSPPEASGQYLTLCQNTAHELIRRTEPNVVIDFANRYDVGGFCLDLEFDFRLVDEYERGNAQVGVAELLDPPHSTVISVAPHLSAVMSRDELEMLREVVPSYLPQSPQTEST